MTIRSWFQVAITCVVASVSSAASLDVTAQDMCCAEGSSSNHHMKSTIEYDIQKCPGQPYESAVATCQTWAFVGLLQTGDIVPCKMPDWVEKHSAPPYDGIADVSSPGSTLTRTHYTYYGLYDHPNEGEYTTATQVFNDDFGVSGRGHAMLKRENGELVAESYHAITEMNTAQQDMGEPCFAESTNVLELSGGLATGDVDISYESGSYSGTYSMTVTVSMLLETESASSTASCNCDSSGGGGYPTIPDPDLVEVQFVDFAADVHGGSNPSSAEQGFIALYSDGSTIRRGLYDHPAFDPDQYGNIVGEREFVLDPGNCPDSTSFSGTADAFSEHDGDLDSDPWDPNGTCWSDRIVLCSLVGLSIGDPGYTPRADFDLDGDIDLDDVALFNLLPCSADFDCDGDVDSQDFTQFLNAYAPGDPIADANCDGVVNSQDLVAFLNSFAVGC